MCCMDKRTNQQMIERTYERLNERLNKWIKMNARTNELTNVWTTLELGVLDVHIHIFALIYINIFCWRLRGDGVVNGCVAN